MIKYKMRARLAGKMAGGRQIDTKVLPHSEEAFTKTITCDNQQGRKCD